MARFMRRVWIRDVEPLLDGRRDESRKTGARVGAKVAGAAGGVLDRLLKLRGKPFTRAMTVMGASLGAMAPDAWDWPRLRRAGEKARATAERHVAEGAAALEEIEALALFGLGPDATREALTAAWHEAARVWHPDMAPDDAQRERHNMRFIAYRAAYERLRAAFEAGRLPRD